MAHATTTPTSRPASPPTATDWQEHLRECILYGLLFKAAMVDLAALKSMPLKLSYETMLTNLSQWAEREHHRLRHSLREKGCILLKSEKQGATYCVQTRIGGYLREVVYSNELLKSECQRRVQLWVADHGLPAN
ncbi:hypothetical protein [Brevibacillus dissolubilis]|uniref:hypothetical protein n=1 Tax=Brevibacillus dissolubilis TaxID=1844116 RepID=UPI001115EB89|nr:hypothetical protein [Brevibacillus dissolubilis]